MYEKSCSIIQIYILSLSMHIQNLIEIHKLIHKLLRINKILMSIKGHNSVKNRPKITCIIYNMDLVYINAYTKFYQNLSICSYDIEEKHIFTSIKGYNLFINEFSPFAIPNHSSHISMFMQSLKKISQKLLKFETGNKPLTDGQMDGHLKQFGGYNIIPCHFFVEGYKKPIDNVIK